MKIHTFTICKSTKAKWIMAEYYRRTAKEKLAQVAFWKKHPLTHGQCLNQLKRLLAQRIARESKSID